MNLGLGAGPSFVGCGSGVPQVTGGGTGAPAQERGLSVLLLEDDASLRQMLVWELSDLGYLVHPVGSCDEARSALAARNFDLALMDVGLPDGDGAELAGEITGTYPELRIFLCSGRPGTFTPERVPSEVSACLIKPVSVGRLDALFLSAV